MKATGIAAAVFSATVLQGCGGAAPAGATGELSGSPVVSAVTLSVAAQLGEKIFKDVTLSGSGKLACATCHIPANAHAPTNDLAAQLGGINGTTAGSRAVPSLRYLNLTPAFAIDKKGAPTGGFNRDGRASTLAEQAQRPFLADHEMANGSKQALMQRLQATSYVEEFRRVFGAAILESPDLAFDRVAFALQQYQKEDREFFPFDAKYDYFLAGKTSLNPAELRGLALFNNPGKGNCAACHPSGKGKEGTPPLFTDFSFDNLGVPRNAAIAANADPQFFDLGLCGPDRSDLRERSELCGKFKVPTLRNVATRKVFFHNGRFNNLRDVIGFYVRRDTNPEEWYPRAADGSVNKFDDLPPALQQNVNRTEVPYNRQPGMAPALSAADIEDVIAFLGTLTDGYRGPD